MNICSEAVESEPIIDNDELEEQAVNLYMYVKELGTLKYEAELRREDSLIQQSSHMQTAFSFMSAALFMAAPILIDNRGNQLSLDYFFAALSSIVFCLLVSLITASLAQRRVLKRTFMSIPEIEDFVYTGIWLVLLIGFLYVIEKVSSSPIITIWIKQIFFPIGN